MVEIFYYMNQVGEEMGLWPGKSVRTDKGPRKIGGFRLGKVIDKENLIFYKSGQGFYRFDPSDQSCHALTPEELQERLGGHDHSQRPTPVIVQFGGSYFLSRLLSEIEYMPVIDSVHYENTDQLHSMFLYYALSKQASCYAQVWYMHSYAKYLYPRASFTPQTISAFLEAIGQTENMQTYLVNHIYYVLDATERAGLDDRCVPMDSPGSPHTCSLYMTRVRVHEGDVHIEFRVVVVVQRGTGLPLYYKLIPDTSVEVAMVLYVNRILKNIGCELACVLGDVDCGSLAVMEQLIWAGLDCMTRLSPHDSLFQTLVQAHLKELARPEHIVEYQGRRLYMLKCKAVIAHEMDTGKPLDGYVYLCRDMLTNYEECLDACDPLGLFAIVSTRDLPPEQVLPEYYIWQGIQPFFDFAAHSARFLPAGCQSLRGHLLLAFSATFVSCLLEYRLKLVAREAMQDAAVTPGDGSAIIAPSIAQEILQDMSAAELLATLDCQMADVSDTEILPEPIAEVQSLYAAYGLHSPEYVERKDSNVFPVLRDGDVDTCSQTLLFACDSMPSDAEVQAADPPPQPVKRGHGRPKGSKNQSTIERERLAAESASADTPPQPVKRGRGRPKGSKSRSTIERERQAAEAANAGAGA